MTEFNEIKERNAKGAEVDREDLKQQILIVDDSELNREILAEMLHSDFRTMEACSGEECLSMLHQYGTGISLVLLDIVMPGMDGFAVLEEMNRNHWLEDIPVIMISSEETESYIRKAYEMGVSDYISRPFDAKVVYRRVFNTIKLYVKQRRLITLVTNQIREKEKNSQILVDILSHIVEFRNGESGRPEGNPGPPSGRIKERSGRENIYTAAFGWKEDGAVVKDISYSMISSITI